MESGTFRMPLTGSRGPRRTGGSRVLNNNNSSNNSGPIDGVTEGGVGSDLGKVIATNDDASATKLSAINKGYYHDPFVQYFVEGKIRQPPLMNRGYYSRVVVLRTLIRDFIALGGKQIVNLGAGFDTTFFVLSLEMNLPSVYFEVDLPQVVRNKTRIINKHEALRRSLPEDASCSDEIHSSRYHLISADLRDTSKLSQLLFSSGLDPKLPTLFISECVLIYMESKHSSAVIEWAASNFESAGFVLYEQILPDDAFGQVMVTNLASRGCPLLGIHDFPTLESQVKRFETLRWQRVQAMDMKQLYQNSRFFDRTELQRVNRLEIFDELEEWHIIQSHYSVVLAVNNMSLSLTSST